MRALPWIISKHKVPMTRDILIGLINNKDEEVSMGATYNLGEFNDNVSVMALIEAINNKIPMVRHNALNAIIKLGQSDYAIAQAISRINDSNEESWVVESAISLLENAHDNNNIVLCVAALDNLAEYRRRIRPVIQENLNIIIYAQRAKAKLLKSKVDK